MAPRSSQGFLMENVPVTETLWVIMCKYFIFDVCIEIARINFSHGHKCKEPVSLKSGGNLFWSHNYEGMTGFFGNLLMISMFVFM